MSVMEVHVSRAPAGCSEQHRHLLTDDLQAFIASLFLEFKDRINELYSLRQHNLKRAHDGVWLQDNKDKLTKRLDIAGNDSEWKVDPVPKVLQDRRLDLGDVDPSNIELFERAMSADVQGIQVDLDDGFCPTWENVLRAHYSVYLAVRNKLPNVPNIQQAPVLLFRPRAWNMTEHHIIVKGLPVPGPLVDFGLHMFHNGNLLHRMGRGPFFYLSKLESASEAKLWDDIFVWSQNVLLIPNGSIKACVLIEDIFSAFEMDEILFALRRHSLGLNCGIWDYCASFVSKFINDPKFLLPDRNKYVNMEQPFLTKYMQLAVKTCRRRGTVATGGMASLIATSEDVIQRVLRAKKMEIEEGVAGFMVYDVNLVPHIKNLWAEFGNQAISDLKQSCIYGKDLLEMPPGGVTKQGLYRNVFVTLNFINEWLRGHGHYVVNDESLEVKSVEDSATAEISRWQVYQWLIHKTSLEDSNDHVTFQLVAHHVECLSRAKCYSKLVCTIYLRMLTLRQPPTFITTYLSDYFLMDEATTTTIKPRL